MHVYFEAECRVTACKQALYRIKKLGTQEEDFKPNCQFLALDIFAIFKGELRTQ